MNSKVLSNESAGRLEEIAARLPQVSKKDIAGAHEESSSCDPLFPGLPPGVGP